MKAASPAFDEPPRRPVLRACASHVSDDELRAIAAHLGAAPAALATLTVPSDISRLYLALTEYASLLAASPSAPRPARLCVFHADPFEHRDERASGSDSDSDADADAADDAAAARSDRSSDVSDRDDDLPRVRETALGLRELYDHISAALEKRKRSKRPAMPKYRMDLGSTLLVWPPPPHLMPDALSKKKSKPDAKPASAPDGAPAAEPNGNAAAAAAADRPPAAEPNGNAAATDRPPVAEPNGNAAAADEQATPQPPSAPPALSDVYKGEQITLHLYHYELGIGEDYAGRARPQRELHIATTHGEAALKRFITGIVHWSEDKKHDRRDGKRFAVFRLKVDSCGDCSWDFEGIKRSRPADSVILGDGQMHAILRDAHNFLKPSTKKWYLRHGLPYRRSYLFYGAPGTGKTSTIRVLAGLFRLDCCFLTLTNSNFSNQILMDAMKNIPSNGILILEDVDALFNEDRKSETPAALTFSGLLNALDGITSAEGMITILSTNHIEKLDPALIRGGRVDKRFHFEKPNSDHIEQMFKNFYPDGAAETAKRFSDAVLARKEGEEARSMATLQQLFIHFREETAEACADGVNEFFENHFPTGAHRKKPAMYI